MKKSFLPLCLITVLLGASLTGCGSSAKPAAEPSTASTVAETSPVADQIVKYKALLDEGIISQEEFELKMKQLLEM